MDAAKEIPESSKKRSETMRFVITTYIKSLTAALAFSMSDSVDEEIKDARTGKAKLVCDARIG